MQTKIMGVLNVTPDSFYAGTRFTVTEQAVGYGIKMADEGADILDIGGESTRPGSEAVDTEEEWKRVGPVIEGLVDGIDAKISVDTYKPEVAEKALEAGAEIINDITGMQSPQMRELAADNGADVVIMHMQGMPKTMQLNPTYQNVVNEIKDFFMERIALCESDGIAPANIVLDPGIGFGKTTRHNLEILRNVEEFKKLGKRLMVGASRKSFIGRILQNEEHPLPPEERLEGSLAMAAYCVWKGVDILRVHDVKETVRAVRLIEALKCL